MSSSSRHDAKNQFTNILKHDCYLDVFLLTGMLLYFPIEYGGDGEEPWGFFSGCTDGAEKGDGSAA